MKTFKEFIAEDSGCDVITRKQLVDLEKFLDRLMAKFDIDVEFTRHFGDRMSDKRNDPCIKVTEIQSLFKKIKRDKAQKVLAHKGSEAVLKDLQKDLNLPFVLKQKRNGEFELVLKTIMRKKNFATSNKKVVYEAELEERKGEDGAIMKTVSPLLFKKNYAAAKAELRKRMKKTIHGLEYEAQKVAAMFNHVDGRKLADMMEEEILR